MAAGFRSPFYIWVGGLNAVSGSGPNPPEPELCTCPTYKRDGTLTNQFTADGSLANQFTADQTLTNQWRKRNCNG